MMNQLFNIKIIKTILSSGLKTRAIALLPKIIRYLPDNWTNTEGQNLFHLSAKYHNEELFRLAVFNKSNINQLDNHGNGPLHRFIEACFVINDNKIKNEKVTFEYNKSLLNLMLVHGADPNLLIKHTDREGQWGEKVATFSRKNIVGNAIELLVSLFWHQILSYRQYNDEMLIKYNEVFKKLTDFNCNINLIVDSGEFFNLESEKLQDAMQFTHKIIVSHFFVKYIVNDAELEEVKPFLMSNKIDFALQDDNYNTVLHHLFGRISARANFLSEEKVEALLLALCLNPIFKPEYVHIPNSFRLTPLGCFKKEAVKYKNFVEKILLNKSLERTLSETSDKKQLTTKRHKI